MLKFFRRQNNKIDQDKSFETIKDLIVNLMPEKLKNMNLIPETKFEEIGFDSIKFINFFLALEDLIHTDLEKIAASIDLTSIRTIRDVMNLVEKFKS